MKLNYHALWKLMSDLIRDLKRRGESVSPQIMNDLRSLKTMIEIARIDRSNPEVLRRIEDYMNNIESYLLPIARERLGQEYVDALMKKIVEAQKNTSVAERKYEKRFPVGVPRDKHWIRIKLTKETPLDVVRQVSEELELNYNVQDDGYVLIYGEKEQIKKFVKRTARRIISEDSSVK